MRFGGSAIPLHPDAVDVQRVNSISRASVIAWCLAGRGFYSEYHSFWCALGVDHLSVTAFNRTVEELEPHLQAILNAEITATQDRLKETNQFDTAKSGSVAEGCFELRAIMFSGPPSIAHSLRLAFCRTDGSWCTPGFNSPHGLVVVRNLFLFGAIVCFHIMSKNHPNDPFLGSSASMESVGATWCFMSLFNIGYGRVKHHMTLDGDEALAQQFHNWWPTSGDSPVGEIGACCGRCLLEA